MSVDARQTAQERFCRHIGDAHEQDTASDEKGPQIGPEWTGVANEWVVDLYAEHSGVRCERVVRCRDCQNATECEDGTLDCHGALVQTWDYWNDEPLRNPVPPDGFCAWGVRKED